MAGMERLAREFPEDPVVLRQHVQWLVLLGRLEQAGQSIREAGLAGTAPRGQIEALQGEAALASWDLEGALCSYREAASLCPQEAEYHERLARICACTPDLRQAQHHLRWASDLYRAGGDSAPAGGWEMRVGFIASWLNEFGVNPVGLKLLQDAMEAPLPGRARALAEVLREEPDYTPAAVLLLITLRQLGGFELMGRVCGREGAWPQCIPRRILQYHDMEEVPEGTARIMASWKRHCPAFETVRFSARGAEAFLQRHFEPAVTAAFRRCHTPAMRSALLHIAYLYRRGGVFCDTGDLCRHSLELLGREHAELILFQEEYGSIDHRFIAAAAGHPLLGRALDRAVSELLSSHRCNPWFTTGPGLISRMAADALLPGLRAAGNMDPLPPWAVLERPQLLRCVSLNVSGGAGERG